MPDLLLRGGRPWGLDAQADVLIRDGVIERIGPDLRADPAAEVVDVPGRLLLPGLIDAFLLCSRQIPIIDSIVLVERSVRARVGGTPSRKTVRVSAMPTRRLAAAPGWVLSSSRASCSSSPSAFSAGSAGRPCASASPPPGGASPGACPLRSVSCVPGIYG